MAGASMKAIKLRIRSVQNTMQITKAMQLVASSKLRGARARMESSHPYFVAAQRAVQDIAAHDIGTSNVYLSGRETVKKRCYVVIAGDRGLAGSYNVNVLKALAESAGRDSTPWCVYPVGKKAAEHCAYQGYELRASGIDRVDTITVAQCDQLADSIMKGFRSGEFDEVYLVYTTFVNVLNQRAQTMRLLPVERAQEETSKKLMLFEPGPEAILSQFLPQYVSGLIYAAACDSYLSEQAARRVAMDSATKNASEMIDDLSLRYNRARQGSITQEITEIVAGSEQH